MSVTLGGQAIQAEDRVREAQARLAPIAAEYPFTPRFFVHDHHDENGGTAQHYVDEGPRDGAPLLFVHGNPTWSFAWRRAIRALSSEYRCVAPDHVGCGLSQKPQRYAYTLRNHAETLERLVLDLDLRNITLVVHDWGGSIGMGFARRHPERIARLVVLNTAAFRSTRMPLRIAACRVPVFGRLAVRGLNAFARAATFMAVERPLPPVVKRGYLLPYDSWEARIATIAFVEDIPMRVGHASWDELGEIEDSLAGFANRPALILWGERDWCFTPEFREEWERRLPGAEVHRFESAGHYVFEDAGDEIVHELTDFLARHPLA
jgi:pimeloyl-ACP methyl ester carboxylesterase